MAPAPSSRRFRQARPVLALGLAVSFVVTGFAGQPSPFDNPQRVSIEGYDGDAMEPALSPDGRILFFNNLNDPKVDTNLYWAERIDDLHFQFRGEVGGVNSIALDGVASMDRNNQFYFVTTRSYPRDYSTLYRGRFEAGKVTGAAVVPGISWQQAPWVNFDAEISPDGETLWFVDSQFARGAPHTADILIAKRSGSGFVRDADAARLMQRVNSKALEYAPAISASGLELYFTRLQGRRVAIMVASRAADTAPFDEPVAIAAITGFAEAPTLSPDEKSLYYHRRDGKHFVIYRVTRP